MKKYLIIIALFITTLSLPFLINNHKSKTTNNSEPMRFISPYDVDLVDNFCIGLLKTVYKYGLIAYNDPTNYEARKELMLASSFSHNGLMEMSRPMCFRCHQFEHVISAYHDSVAHGEGLAIVWPAYSKYIYKNEIALPKFLRLAYEVFNVKETNDKYLDAYNGILKIEEFFKLYRNTYSTA